MDQASIWFSVYAGANRRVRDAKERYAKLNLMTKVASYMSNIQLSRSLQAAAFDWRCREERTYPAWIDPEYTLSKAPYPSLLLIRDILSKRRSKIYPPRSLFATDTLEAQIIPKYHIYHTEMRVLQTPQWYHGQTLPSVARRR